MAASLWMERDAMLCTALLFRIEYCICTKESNHLEAWSCVSALYLDVRDFESKIVNNDYFLSERPAQEIHESLDFSL